MAQLTSICIAPDKEQRFREAVEYYGFESMAAFFRLCGNALIVHYERRDGLCMPLGFECFAGNGKKDV